MITGIGRGPDADAADDARPAAVRDQPRADRRRVVRGAPGPRRRSPGVATASGTASSRPERSASRSGSDWPRARRTRSSGSRSRSGCVREARGRHRGHDLGERRGARWDRPGRRGSRCDVGPRRRGGCRLPRSPSRSSVAWVHRAPCDGGRWPPVQIGQSDSSVTMVSLSLDGEPVALDVLVGDDGLVVVGREPVALDVLVGDDGLVVVGREPVALDVLVGDDGLVVVGREPVALDVLLIRDLVDGCLVGRHAGPPVVGACIVGH